MMPPVFETTCRLCDVECPQVLVSNLLSDCKPAVNLRTHSCIRKPGKLTIISQACTTYGCPKRNMSSSQTGCAQLAASHCSESLHKHRFSAQSTCCWDVRKKESKTAGTSLILGRACWATAQINCRKMLNTPARFSMKSEHFQQ